MQSDWWLQLILPKKCARSFFLLSKNISCAETACLLLRTSLSKFLGVFCRTFWRLKILAMNILLSWHKSHLQRDFWLELFSHLSEIFLIQKQQDCFEELVFRVLELQNFLASKNSCNEYFVELTQISLATWLLTWVVFSSFWNLFDSETAGLLWKISL